MSSSCPAGSPADRLADLLETWLGSVLATPGLTSISDLDEARAMLLEDALRAVPLLDATDGPIVDVGAGGGSPGVPLAVVVPDREFVLLEAERRKCAFLERMTADLANVRVVRGRAEEQPAESFGVALAKALARPPVAAELCLPLAVVGGSVLLWVGPSAVRELVSQVADRLGGEVRPERVPGIVEIRKVAPTPPGYPRRPGMAKKRPLA